jgi:hypothetical protein
MAKLLLEIKNAGDKCGRCATTRKRRYGDGQEVSEPWCNIFGRYLHYDEDGQTISRLPQCFVLEVHNE